MEPFKDRTTGRPILSSRAYPKNFGNEPSTEAYVASDSGKTCMVLNPNTSTPAAPQPFQQKYRI